MRLLIIGDLNGQLTTASKIAIESGAKVIHAATVDLSKEIFRSAKQINIVFIDVSHEIKPLTRFFQNERICNIPIIACGSTNDAEKAVKAIEDGAKEYLPLPPQIELIAAILETIANANENLDVVYASKIMDEVLITANKIAKSNASILITSESGCGKEVIAKYIHKNSNRSKYELIAINCAAIPENLLESELFGHEKGSFTGALERRIGKFEAANGSTILLDEISEMDLKLQAKLLRVLQEKEIVRIGGNNIVKLDVRIIATSNRDLLSYIKEGKFREDLFYRLNVINIEIPPLRIRSDDILKLAEHFVLKHSQFNNINSKKISDLASKKLLNYNWPGNVRELENCMHRALLLGKSDVIEQDDILLTQSQSSYKQKTLIEIEEEAISQTLLNCNGDELKASVILGISIRMLKNKLKEIKN